MEYYGASEDERKVVSSLLGLKLSEMGQDWEFTFSDADLIAPAINILLKREEDWGVRAAVACIMISSLYEYHRDKGESHPLLSDALIALRKDESILVAMLDFWKSGGGSKYIIDMLKD